MRSSAARGLAGTSAFSCCVHHGQKPVTPRRRAAFASSGPSAGRVSSRSAIGILRFGGVAARVGGGGGRRRGRDVVEPRQRDERAPHVPRGAHDGFAGEGYTIGGRRL